MLLKFKHKKKEEIPAGLEPFYKETNGEFHLEIEGAVEADTLAEFRNNNREIMRLLGVNKIEDAKAKLAELLKVDPAKYQEMLDEAAAREADPDKGKKKLTKAEEDALVEGRVSGLKTEHKKLLDTKDGEITRLSKSLHEHLIHNAITSAAGKKGVRPAALDDIVNRGAKVFRLDNDGKVVAFDGDKEMYGNDGKGLTVEGWIDQVAAKAEHLFEPNKGGGGGGGKPVQGWNGPNPYTKATLNLTAQAKLERENPGLAQSLKASAT